VTSGQKFNASDAALPGHDFAWTYDDIGNRKTAVTNGQTATYTSTSLNQYSGRTVPGAVDVLGAATTGSTVTVSANGGTPQATTRSGELFFQQLAVDNASSAQLPSIKVTGVKNNVGTGGEDAVTEITKTPFVAQTPEGFGYDSDGNLTSDARWTYTWDGENRLIALQTSAAAATAGAPNQKLEFAYDGQGRRVSKKVSNWSGSSWALASQTLFLYDGWNMVAELNALSGNAAVRTYVWGLDLSGSAQGAGGVGGLLVASDGANTCFAAMDGNGNVAAYVTAGGGTTVASHDYNAFGETIMAEGAAVGVFPWGFSTKYAESESGLLYYGLRYYNAGTGRWLTRDSIEEQGGANLYAFVGNNAANFVDALGQRPISFYFDAFINGNRGSWLPEPGPNVANYYFKTDERDFGQFNAASRNARLFSFGSIESTKIGQAENGGASALSDTGDSHRRRLLTPLTWGPEETKKASLATNTVTVKDGPCETTVSITAGASYPFISVAPNIDYHVEFTFKKLGNGRISVQVKGSRNNFPDYEGSVDGTLRYQWKSPSSGPGLINLNTSTSFEKGFEIQE